MKDKLPIYKIFRALLSWIYKAWYNPTIIGSENIPTSKSGIIASNHIHIYDQCNIIIITKRYIRYMAKMEYFKGCLSWFFKGVGCIPVKRDHKDEEAINTAIEVLNKGHCLGIFPEGTRNNVKDDKMQELYNKYHENIGYKAFSKKLKTTKMSQIDYLEKLYNSKIITLEDIKNNIFQADKFLQKLVKLEKISTEEYYDSLLLPLKYGAVSMAYKTSNEIIPVAVSGNYKFRSKDLIIRIGTPFKVTEDLEAANNKLRKEIIELLKENINNSGK